MHLATCRPSHQLLAVARAAVVQAQQSAAQQAEVLLGLANRLQQVERDARDNQDLITAMQGTRHSALSVLAAAPA